jgi:hypothetical protein
MNAYGRNSRLLNSLIPARTNTLVSAQGSSFVTVIYVVVACLLITAVALLIAYRDDVTDGWNTAVDLLKSYFEKPTPMATTPSSHMPMPPSSLTASPMPPGLSTQAQSNIVEKVLPSGSDVFNVSSNKFTYYDAQPLCAALGAELATYDQVKDAWSKGADWCNYGWVKGQMAVYPTSADTYKKMQSGPEEGRNSCGQPGVNGGYFDNPELKYGVTCYGKKPPQTSHSAADVAKNTPTSPSALAYEQKVNEFKAQADSLGILPFNGKTWN